MGKGSRTVAVASSSAAQPRIQNHGKQDASAELVQTMRLLARSHRRFTEEQKVKVFRSMIKETRITEAGVEFEMYVQPVQNVWWKYRQKGPRRKGYQQNPTVRIAVPQRLRPDRSVYTTGQVAAALGISADNLRWRIKMGRYPDAPRGNGQRRIFTSEHVQQMRSMR